MKKLAVLLLAALFLGACHCNCKQRKCSQTKTKTAVSDTAKKAKTPKPAKKKAAVKDEDFAGVAKVSRAKTGAAVLSFSKPINFKYNSDVLTPESEKSVRQIARALKKYPDNKIVVAGYTDSLGDANYNIDLSQRRAKSVADQLVKEGVKPENVTYVGHGASNPVATNKTAEGRAQNRRVELEILD